MAGSANQFVYQLGVTQVVLAPLQVMQIIPPRTTMGYYFGPISGGSLSIMNAAGVSGGLGGYLMQTTERVHIDGPATFFLGATGATAICGIVFKYSAGFSALP